MDNIIKASRDMWVRASRGDPDEDSLNAFSSIIRSAKLAPVRSEDILLDYIFSQYRKSNEYSVISIEPGNGARGLFLMHNDLRNLARFGTMEPTTNNVVNRSYLIVDQDYFHSIGASENDTPYFPSVEAQLSLITSLDEIVKESFVFLPKFSDSELEVLRQLYETSAYHLLTRDVRAEAIWRHVADIVNENVTPFSEVERAYQPNNGNDGGVDDLRSGNFGLLANQVKGATKYSTSVRTGKGSPEREAQNFFDFRGQEMRESARRTRLSLYPKLSEQSRDHAKGVIIDDVMPVHYVGIGKIPSLFKSLRGTTVRKNSFGLPIAPIPRIMYLSRIDVIVLKPSFYFTDMVRVDASLNSNWDFDSPASSSLAQRSLATDILDLPSP